MTGKSRGLTWAIVNAAMVPVLFVSAFGLGIALAMTGNQDKLSSGSGFDLLLRLVFVVFYATAPFTMRGQMEEHPIGMHLNAGLTLVLGAIYFQYHMQNYVLPEPAEVYGPLTDVPAYVPAPTYPQAPSA